VRLIDLLPKGSEEVPKGGEYYVNLFVTNAPASTWRKLGYQPTTDIDMAFTHPTLGSVVWRQCIDRTQSPPVYRFFFVPSRLAPPASSDWHIRASNPSNAQSNASSYAAAAAVKK
jgi:hypothetical protein